MNTIGQSLRWAALQLIESSTPELDSEVLLGHVLNMSRTKLYTYPEQAVDDDALNQFKALIQLRAQGKPVGAIIHEQEFWSMSFYVNEDVLIPRQDTEILVEHALNLDHASPLKVLDLGTGSGAIACALAHTCPNWQVTAIERNEKALQIAAKNISKFSLTNVNLLQGTWFEPCQGMLFDLIVSNPPYISPTDPHLTTKALSFEPLEALASQDDGYQDLSHIIETAPSHLIQNGMLIVEHGYQQGARVRQMMLDAGLINIQTKQDLAQHERITIARTPL
jgi:release factor glutamine methyltransferase